MHLYSTSNTEVSIHILDYPLNILRVYFYNTSRWGRNTFAKYICEYWKIFLKIWFPVKWQTITATFFTASASSFCWGSEGCSWLSKVLLSVTRSRSHTCWEAAMPWECSLALSPVTVPSRGRKPKEKALLPELILEGWTCALHTTMI